LGWDEKEKKNMALERRVYERFQFTLPSALSDPIVKAQRHVHPDEDHAKIVIPVFWVGAMHLTPAQFAAVETSVKPFIEKPFEWRISNIACKDTGCLICLTFEFTNTADKKRFFDLRMHIYTRLKAVGVDTGEVDTPTEENSVGHCVCVGLHGNLSLAYESLDMYRSAPDRVKVGNCFQTHVFQLARTDNTVVYQW